MDIRNWAEESVIVPLRDIESMGNKQFCKHVFTERAKSIHDSIKRNSVKNVIKPKPKKTPKKYQLQMLKNDVSLFGRLYIANQLRDGDPVFF